MQVVVFLLINFLSLGEKMSIRYSVILAALAVMSVSALAESKPQTTLTAPGMGTVDGILTYCQKVDHMSAAKYMLGLDNFTKGHSKDELEDIRASTQYKTTREALNTQLLKVSNSAGISACRNYLAGK
jgi:hypothetical protein